MLHPIFSTLISRPGLVVDHLAGYASLVRDETSDVGIELAKRAIAWAAALVAALVFLILAGVALLIGLYNGAFHWSLIVVPLLPLILAGVAVTIARRPLSRRAFTELRSQLAADAEMLRGGGAK